MMEITFRYLIISMKVLIMSLLNKIRKFILNKKVPISMGFYLFSEKNLRPFIGRFPQHHLWNDLVYKKLLIFAKPSFGYSVIQLNLSHHSTVTDRNTINTRLCLTQTTAAISVNINFSTARPFRCLNSKYF